MSNPYDQRVQVAALEFERRLVFEGCFDFRDLGGHRADGPRALTDADAEQLRSLALT